MAISRGIAQLLNHKIGVRSWTGRGSVFSICIPIVEPPVSEVEPLVEPQIQAADLSRLKVLCVDDEPEILLAMQDLLQRWGCEVRLAEDMTQTQNQLKDAWRPDVVLSDYRLQDQVTGLDVLKLCRQVVGDEFAGVIISADRTPEIVDRVKYHGFEFLPKPVKPLKLRGLLNTQGMSLID